MNNKRGGVGAKILLVLILMIASAVGGAYGYSVLDGKLAVKDAQKDIESVRVSDYDSPESTEIQGYIDQVNKDLETAKSRKEVYEIMEDFNSDVSKVKTRTQKELEEAKRAAEEAKQKYNNSNNNQGTELPFSTEQPADNTNNTDNSNNANSTDNSGNYKSNDLTNGQDQEEDNGGFLNSLIGGMTSGASGN